MLKLSTIPTLHDVINNLQMHDYFNTFTYFEMHVRINML